MNKIISFFKGLTKKQKRLCAIVGGTLAFVLIVFFVLYDNGYSGLHTNSKYHEGQIKVACVGDSTTYGHGISGWARNNYPAKLQEMLGDSYHVQNFGKSGSTASDDGDQPYTQSAEYTSSIEYDADILVIMLGTNDSKKENWTGAIDFTNRMDSLIESYKKDNPDLRVIICTPTCAFFPEGQTDGKTNFDVRPNTVAEIKNHLRSYALSHGYELVDIYDLTRYHSEWFGDNVHPSNDGAQAIAEAIGNKIKNN